MKRIILINIVIIVTYWCGVNANKSSKQGSDTCEEFVGFSSVGAHLVHPSGHIQFRKDIFDSGHGWVRDVGTFTITCPGVYSVSFTGYGDSNTRLVLKKRSSTSKNSWEPIISTPPGGGSVSTICSVEKGEQLAVNVSGTLRSDIEQPVSVTCFNAHKIKGK